MKSCNTPASAELGSIVCLITPIFIPCTFLQCSSILDMCWATWPDLAFEYDDMQIRVKFVAETIFLHKSDASSSKIRHFKSKKGK